MHLSNNFDVLFFSWTTDGFTSVSLLEGVEVKSGRVPAKHWSLNFPAFFDQLLNILSVRGGFQLFLEGALELLPTFLLEDSLSDYVDVSSHVVRQCGDGRRWRIELHDKVGTFAVPGVVGPHPVRQGLSTEADELSEDTSIVQNHLGRSF